MIVNCQNVSVQTSFTTNFMRNKYHSKHICRQVRKRSALFLVYKQIKYAQYQKNMMNNLFKLTPIMGTIKNTIKLNHLQKMSFCSVESQKNHEKCKFEFLRLPNNISTTKNIANFAYIFSAINTIMLLGRMGGEPQVRGNEKTPIISFSMATNFNYKTYASKNCYFTANLSLCAI